MIYVNPPRPVPLLAFLTPSPVDNSMKRSKMSPGASRANFTAGASKTHYKNLQTGSPMRGGIRL